MRPYEKLLLNKYKPWINITYNYSFIIFPFISFFYFLPKKKGCVTLLYLAYAINNLFSSYEMFQNDTTLKLYNQNIISLSIKLEDRYFCLQCLTFQQTKLVISASPTNFGGGGVIFILFYFLEKLCCLLCKRAIPIICLSSRLFLTFYILNFFFTFLNLLPMTTELFH